MAIEIERKFLTVSDAWRGRAHRVIEMAQGYLNDAESVRCGRQNASVRVRLEGEQARLNIKSRELGAARQEFDYPIPPADARALLALCVGGVVHKRRHLVQHAGHVWEVDEFAGDNAGLVVAEVELQAEDETVVLPDWAGREVTHLPRYYNLNLAAHPFARWSAEARAGLDENGERTCS